MLGHGALGEFPLGATQDDGAFAIDLPGEGELQGPSVEAIFIVEVEAVDLVLLELVPAS